MNNREIMKQIVEFNRVSVNSVFEVLTLVQDQAEKMTDSMFSQNALVPREAINMISQWSAACKQGKENFHKGVNEYLNRTAAFWNMG